MLVAAEQRQVVDEDSPTGEAGGVGVAARRDRPVAVEHALEVLIDVLDRGRAQRVEDPAHRHPAVGMRVAAGAGGDEDPAVVPAVLPDRRRVGVPIAQEELDLGR